MRNMLLASAAVLGFALALPAFAQTATDPNPVNPSSIKDGTPAAGTGSGAAPGNDPAAAGKTGATLGSQAPQTDPGPLGNQANPAPSSGSSMGSGASGTESNGTMSAPATGSPSPDTSSTPTDTDNSTSTATKPRHRSMSSNEGGGHWAHQPGTGVSGPASARASNIDSADTRSVIAPHLPAPGVGRDAGPDRYLRAADRALRSHKTGEAQQALEMAETRLLDRSTAPSDASQPDQAPRIAAVTAARKALAAKDWEGARKNIQEAMNGSEAGDQMTSSGGMAAGTTGGGMGTTTSSMSSSASSTSTGGMGTTSTMAPNSTNQGVAGGNAGASPAPMDPSAQGPASPGAAGSPTPGASTTVPNQMQPSSGAK